MPLIYIAVIDLCFILDVDVPLICARITAVYRILTFIEKRFDQRETRQSCIHTLFSHKADVGICRLAFSARTAWTVPNRWRTPRRFFHNYLGNG